MKLPEIMLALVSCISLKWPVTSEQTPKHGFFFPLLITVLLIKELFSLLILGSCVSVPLFNKDRDSNCQWKENVLRFPREVVGTNLLLNHVKLCFVYFFYFVSHSHIC